MKRASSANSDPLVISLFRLWSPIYDSPIFQWVYYGRIHDRFLDAARDLTPARILDVG